MTYTVIPKADMAHGAYYKGFCRNARVARWDATNNLFVHWRSKFDDVYLETILHADDGGSWDTFKPFRLLPTEAVEFPIPFKFEGDDFPEPTSRAMYLADMREFDIERDIMKAHEEKVDALPREEQITLTARALLLQQDIYAQRSQAAGYDLTPLQAACAGAAWDDLDPNIRDAFVSDATLLVDRQLQRRAERAARPKDGCEICKGEKGGTPGNENIINGQVVCDYCHADMIEAREKS